MKTNDKKIIEYAALAIAIILSAAVFLQVKNRDVNFCRSIFSGLARGSYRAQKHIDWDNFRAVGEDVGVVYRSIVDDDEKTAYKKAFIENFAKGFKEAQGRLKLFTNWRIYDKGNGIVVVAADYKKGQSSAGAIPKVLLFFISKYKGTKLVAIQWSYTGEFSTRPPQIY